MSDVAADHEGLGRRVGTSALWSAVNAGGLRASTFVVSLIIARLIAPFEFGVFTVALTVFNIIFSIAELGVSSAIVREPQRTKEIAPTVFTISLATGAILAGLMVALAPLIAGFLGEPRAAGSVRVLSLVVLLSGFSAVPAALMSRDFMQRQRFVVDASYVLSSTGVLIALVAAGHDVMALAVSRVVGQLVTVILIYIMAPERYLPGFSWTQARSLLAFGLPLAGSNLLTLAIANVDFIVVARLLGATKLGYYNLAFNISGWPVSIFSAILISVTLPTLSRVRDSAVELTRHLSAGLTAVVAASFPICALLAALSAPLIDVVYGGRWHSAYQALIVLAVFGAARTVLTLFSDLTIALGLTKRLFSIQLIWLAVLVPAMVVGVNLWGIAGAGMAHSAVIIAVVIPAYLVTVRSSTELTLNWIWPCLGRPFCASVAAGLAAAFAVRMMPDDLTRLLLGLVLGLAVYVVLAFGWLVKTGKRLRSLYWNRSAAEAGPDQLGAASPLLATTTDSFG